MWEKVKFLECVKDVTGGKKKVKQECYLIDGKYPIIDQGEKFIGGHIDDEDKVIKVSKPFVIFGDHSKCIKYIDFDFVLGADGVKVLSVSDDLLPKFLYYFLQTLKLPNVGYSRHFKFLKEFFVPLPPLAIQEQIVTILDKADRLRQLDKAIEEKYDALAQSIFIDMFGDPVKNEKGWETEKLSIVAPFRRYEGLVEDFESKFWLLNLDMIKSNGGNVISKLFVEKEEIGNSTITFNQEQVLYSKLRPYLNKVVLPDSSGYATTELVPLNPKKEILNRVFLCYLLRSKSFVHNIEEKVAGAKMPRVSMDVLRDFITILPPIELQNEFARKIELINQMKEREMKGEELFQALLQKAFKGELVS